VHVSRANPSVVQGLEFLGLDLPDSLSEIIMGGLLFLQVQLIFRKIKRFVQARVQKGNFLFLSVPSHSTSNMLGKVHS
jgi:hypothetical protein